MIYQDVSIFKEKKIGWPLYYMSRFNCDSYFIDQDPDLRL